MASNNGGEDKSQTAKSKSWRHRLGQLFPHSPCAALVELGRKSGCDSPAHFNPCVSPAGETPIIPQSGAIVVGPSTFDGVSSPASVGSQEVKNVQPSSRDPTHPLQHWGGVPSVQSSFCCAHICSSIPAPLFPACVAQFLKPSAAALLATASQKLHLGARTSEGVLLTRGGSDQHPRTWV